MTGDRVPVRADLADLDPYGAPQLDVPVRLNTNETPWPPPPAFVAKVTQAAAQAAAGLHRYPDRRAWALRTALGRRVGLPPERTWAANGSNEVLQQLLLAYGGPGRTALLFDPGYSLYPLLARVTATPTAHEGLDGDLRLTPEVARRAVAAHDPDLILVANPNNPTGMTVSETALRALHDSSRALLVVDEAYVDFGGRSALALELPRVVVCRTFSKAWRLAGLRLGWCHAQPWVVDDLRRVRLPYHLDALTQAAGLAALELADEVTAHVADLAAERDRLAAALAALDGVETWPSAANFVLFRTPLQGRALFEALLARGVLVRDFSTLPRLERCLRVSVGTPEEDDVFLAALKDVLA